VVLAATDNEPLSCASAPAATSASGHSASATGAARPHPRRRSSRLNDAGLPVALRGASVMRRALAPLRRARVARREGKGAAVTGALGDRGGDSAALAEGPATHVASAGNRRGARGNGRDEISAKGGVAPSSSVEDATERDGPSVSDSSGRPHAESAARRPRQQCGEDAALTSRCVDAKRGRGWEPRYCGEREGATAF